MAATASFKQQCPSCEAWVPIRDPNLIGRKIDCPKCKYRFVVEDPGTAAEDEEEAETPAAKKSRRDERDAGAKRAANGKGGAVKGKAGPRRRDADGGEEDGKRARGKGSGSSTKLIVGVGLGVVAVGILAAVGYFMFMNNESPKTTSQPSRGVASSAPAAPAEPAPEEGEKPAPTPAAAAVASLPGSTEVLTNLLPPDTEGVCNIHLKDLLRTSLGRTIFATPGAFRSEAIQQRLGLAVEDIDLLVQAWNFTQNWSFNVIHTTKPINPEAVKTALQARPAPEGKIEDQEYFLLEPNAWLDSLGNLSFATLLQINPAQIPPHTGKRALRIFDDQTLVLADVTPMKQFLAVKGRFPPKQQPKEAAPKEAAEGTEAGPTGGSVIPPGRRGAPPPPEPTAPDTEAAPPAPSGAYLTINPNLKSMLDAVERKQPVLSLAVDTQASRGRMPSLGLSALEATLNASLISKLALKTILEEAGILGAALHLKDGLSLTLAEECQNEDVARKRYASIRKDTGPDLAKLLSAALGTNVEMLDEEGSDADNPFGGGERTNPAAGGGPITPAPPRPGIVGGGGLRPGPAGGPGYYGRSAYGYPGGPGNLPPQQPTEAEKPKPGGTIRLEVHEKTILLLTISLIDPAANSRLTSGKIRQMVLQQKGYLDMAGGQIRVHELGDAARRHTEANGGRFPRGTVERKIPTARAGRPYEPKQRVSWLAELLPYLGPEQASLERGIDRDKSWNDAENLGAAATLVPQFLNPHYAPATWWVRYPGMKEPTAATHYVGIAGIGADAAEYSPDDPNTAKKLGVLGYDRTTRLQDITDGASNTILMAQVPPTYKRPWMAGGGSTVLGVLERDSVRPFVSPQPDGKRGTLVVMADGSVRFVAENIKDEVFQALCAIKGGEANFILDRDAPPVPRPEGQAELTVPAELPTAAAPQATASLPAEWKEFVSQEGGFSVLMPGTPEKQTQVVQTPIGPVTIHTFKLELKNDAGAFVTSYSDYNLKPGQFLDVDKALEGARNGGLANMPGSKLLKEQVISFKGLPGRELTIDWPVKKGEARWRYYLANLRMYQVVAIGPKGMSTSTDADKFFDSFKLLAK